MVRVEQGLYFAPEAHAVLFDSGMRVREIARNEAVLGSLRRPGSTRQLIGAQCSGTLLLA